MAKVMHGRLSRRIVANEVQAHQDLDTDITFQRSQHEQELASLADQIQEARSACEAEHHKLSEMRSAANTITADMVDQLSMMIVSMERALGIVQQNTTTLKATEVLGSIQSLLPSLRDAMEDQALRVYIGMGYTKTLAQIEDQDASIELGRKDTLAFVRAISDELTRRCNDPVIMVETLCREKDIPFHVRTGEKLKDNPERAKELLFELVT